MHQVNKDKDKYKDRHKDNDNDEDKCLDYHQQRNLEPSKHKGWPPIKKNVYHWNPNNAQNTPKMQKHPKMENNWKVQK